MFAVLILDLREAYITNLSLLACLEPFEKFVVGGWSRPILVLSLVPKLNNTYIFSMRGGVFPASHSFRPGLVYTTATDNILRFGICRVSG